MFKWWRGCRRDHGPAQWLGFAEWEDLTVPVLEARARASAERERLAHLEYRIAVDLIDMCERHEADTVGEAIDAELDTITR